MTETCNNGTCQEIKDIYERFYGNINQEVAFGLVTAKMKALAETIGCSGTCLPLLQLISKHNQEQDAKQIRG